MVDPVIDPRNEEELTQQAKVRAYQLSGQRLSDFSEAGALDTLIRTQAYSGAELLFYANQLVPAFVLSFLGLTGVFQSKGQKATVTLTFRLNSVRPIPFYVPTGFQVLGRSGQVSASFFTDSELVIPSGDRQGSVTATAEAVGEKYNFSEGLIKLPSQPLAFLESVTNLEKAQGGLEAETNEKVAERAFATLRRRSPVSELDFEEQAEEILGQGSRAKAVGLLAQNGTAYEAGAVHLFLLDASGLPATQAQKDKVALEFEPIRLIGTKLYLSQMRMVDIAGEVIAKLQPQTDPEVVANDLWRSFGEYLDRTRYKPGDEVRVEEVRHELRFAEGLAFIEDLKLNGERLNIPMPTVYSMPNPYSLAITLVTDSGAIFNVLRGAGEPPDYNPSRVSVGSRFYSMGILG